MSDAQTLPADHESEAINDENVDRSEETTTRRRRRFRPDEIALAHRFKALAEPGEPIPFSSLDRDMKKAVLPWSGRTRLLDRGVIETSYDEDTGTIESVSINNEIWAEFESDLTPVEPKRVNTNFTAPGEVRQRKPRTILSDPKYKIRKLSETNPRRAGSHAWYNWEECYRDDISIPEYLSFMNYNRMIITSNGTYFNGPSTLFIDQDLKSGYIGVYDSTLPAYLDSGEANPAVWLSWQDVEAGPQTDPVAEESENGSNPVTTSQTGEAGNTGIVPENVATS